tara:strand:+ start:195 stop:482 length:288 start_codon:yes stop_codon:yes gene_type:complete
LNIKLLGVNNMTKTVSVNMLGHSVNMELDEFINMYTNEIKSLRYQLIVRISHDTMEIINNKQQLENRLNKAIRAVELCAKRVFENELLLQTSRSE